MQHVDETLTIIGMNNCRQRYEALVRLFSIDAEETAKAVGPDSGCRTYDPPKAAQLPVRC
jgi:hypothetical protein